MILCPCHAPLQGVRRRHHPMLQPSVFSPAIRTPEHGVHAPASSPSSSARDGSSSSPVCDWWILGVFGSFPDGEGSFGEGTWYTRVVTSDSLYSLLASVGFVCVLLFTPAACHGRS